MDHRVDIEDGPRNLLLEAVVDHTLGRYSLVLGLAVAVRSLGLDRVMIVAHKLVVGGARLDRTLQEEHIQKPSAE